MRRLLYLLTLLCAFAAPGVTRAVDNLERTITGDGVMIRLTSPLSQLPPGGAIPFTVTIRNDADNAASWQMRFTNQTNYARQNTSTYEQDFQVAAHATTSFDILVPLPQLATSPTSYNQLQVRASGPGVNSSITGGSASYYDSGSSIREPFALLGNDLLGKSGLGPLETYDKAQHRELAGGGVDAANLPTDWRAYSGVATVLLCDTEWLSLSPAQHDALCDYIAQGGRLTLFTKSVSLPISNTSLKTNQQAPSSSGLNLPTTDGNAGSYGFGQITLLSSLTQPPEAASLSSTINHDPAPTVQQTNKAFGTAWDLRKPLGVIAVNSLFIFLFVLSFGILIGPINLFLFSHGRNRFRLFWTTPLISIVASILLMAGILLVDGIGGRGTQMIAVFSLPGQNREVVIQEQAARTALLFSSQWQNNQNYLINPVSADAMLNSMQHSGPFSGIQQASNYDQESNEYLQQGNRMSGTWFRSRSLCGQYLQAMVPSRSTLSITNADAFRNQGAAPVVLSSFPGALDEVYLIDARTLHYWYCTNLSPGRPTTCISRKPENFDRFWDKAIAPAGGKLRPLLNGARNHPGYFYATGSPSGPERLNTLDAIRWQVDSGVYLGPWVIAPTRENNP